MRVPLQVVFHNIKSSDWIEELVRERVQKLEQFCAQIMSCRVVVDMPHKHHQSGNFYQVRIDISVPDKEIVVNKTPNAHHAAKDIHNVLRDAFDSARRQLEEYQREQRREIKAHIAQPVAHVARLFPEENYGFLLTDDGREVYFNFNSVLGKDPARLEIGSEVTFVEETGEKGPQASTVRLA